MRVRLLPALLVACMLIGASPYAAQAGPPAQPPPGDPVKDPSKGPACGPNSESGEPCWDPEICADLGVVCNEAGVPVGDQAVCTGDEGEHGRMIRCVTPAPDAPDPPEHQDPRRHTRITRSETIACDAVAPPPDWADAGLPDQALHASPPGIPDHPAITGMETWLWASGPQAHYWTTTGHGVVTRLTFAQDGVQADPPDGDIAWGPEYVLDTQTWACLAQAGWSAAITAWDWTLQPADPDSDIQPLTATGDTQGRQPDYGGSGWEASVHLEPQTKAVYRLTLTTTWHGDWGPTHTQTHDPVDYHISEIISRLGPRDP